MLDHGQDSQTRIDWRPIGCHMPSGPIGLAASALKTCNPSHNAQHHCMGLKSLGFPFIKCSSLRFLPAPFEKSCLSFLTRPEMDNVNFFVLFKLINPIVLSKELNSLNSLNLVIFFWGGTNVVVYL